MCGRYSLTTPAEAVRALFDYPERPNLPARANIAPTQDVAAVRLARDGGDAATRSRHFAWLRWGLIPHWAREAAVGNRLINARAESLAEKAAFRTAFAKRRCLIPADGFFEWRREGSRRQPYRITLLDSGVFGFAGLWERWRNPADGAAVESCTIVTTVANELVRPIHDRMPVILEPAGFAEWLDPRTPAMRAQALLRPFPAAALRLYPVSPRLNSPVEDDPALLAPIAPEALEPDSEPAGAPAQPRLL